jgi:hypothetical protein
MVKSQTLARVTQPNPTRDCERDTMAALFFSPPIRFFGTLNAVSNDFAGRSHTEGRPG